MNNPIKTFTPSWVWVEQGKSRHGRLERRAMLGIIERNLMTTLLTIGPHCSRSGDRVNLSLSVFALAHPTLCVLEVFSFKGWNRVGSSLPTLLIPHPLVVICIFKVLSSRVL